MASDFTIKLRGVRGTVPTAGADFIKYGGNTSCTEVQVGGRLLILDAGTGIIALGNENDINEADILLSHTHLDHIQGFPFFRPIYDKNSIIRIWSGHLESGGAHAALTQIMNPPVFPVPLDELVSQLEFIDFKAGDELGGSFDDSGIKIKTTALNHPDNATAYRIEYNGKSVCYVTDIEHEEGQINAELVDFIGNADIFLYDSTFTDENYSAYKGWGHSTWQEGVRLGSKAGVKNTILFHHDPAATDSILDARAEELAKTKDGEALFAKENMVFEL